MEAEMVVGKLDFFRERSGPAICDLLQKITCTQTIFPPYLTANALKTQHNPMLEGRR